MSQQPVQIIQPRLTPSKSESKIEMNQKKFSFPKFTSSMNNIHEKTECRPIQTNITVEQILSSSPMKGHVVVPKQETIEAPPPVNPIEEGVDEALLDIKVEVTTKSELVIEGEIKLIMKSGRYFIKYIPLGIKTTHGMSFRHLLFRRNEVDDVSRNELDQQEQIVFFINDIHKLFVVDYENNTKCDIVTFIPLTLLPFQIPDLIMNKTDTNKFISVLNKICFVRRDGNEYILTISSLSKRISSNMSIFGCYMENINKSQQAQEKRARWKRNRGNAVTTVINTPQKPITCGYFKELRNKGIIRYDGQMDTVLDEKIRSQILVYGIDERERREGWLYCLGIEPNKNYDKVITNIDTNTQKVIFLNDKTLKENEDDMNILNDEYNRIKLMEESIFDGMLVRWKELRDTWAQIEKDVVRVDYSHVLKNWKDPTTTLRKLLHYYALYNFKIGYVQGCHDLALGLMEVLTDEKELFFTFVKVMNICKSDYENTTMSDFDKKLKPIINHIDSEFAQYLNENDICLNFMYSWIALLFRREFDAKDVSRIWDVCYSFLLIKIELIDLGNHSIS